MINDALRSVVEERKRPTVDRTNELPGSQLASGAFVDWGVAVRSSETPLINDPLRATANLELSEGRGRGIFDKMRLEKLMFLPGAGGDVGLWKPIAQGLAHRGERHFVVWPGFAGVPADPLVKGLDDLIRRVTGAITGPVVLFAQSMGGLIALHAALSVPKQIRGLVLSVTSGGIDVAAMGATDWRPQFARENPATPRWFLDAHDDLSVELRRIEVPALLLWGTADPISPLAVGRRLTELLPDSELVVVPGGTHDLVSEPHRRRPCPRREHPARHLGPHPLRPAPCRTHSATSRSALAPSRKQHLRNPRSRARHRHLPGAAEHPRGARPARPVLETLSRRGVDPRERHQLSEWVTTAQRAEAPRGLAPRSETAEPGGSQLNPNDADPDAELLALHAWFEDWSTTARSFIRRKDWLIRMGLARRARGGRAEE